mmetsp:Transcript_38290/g.66476  ORF Transcript_38290/g.66476 Transcript_38290/m.66476 type:complete len:253 (+) Transcript_38290:1440-2198(+)
MDHLKWMMAETQLPSRKTLKSPVFSAYFVISSRGTFSLKFRMGTRFASHFSPKSSSVTSNVAIKGAQMFPGTRLEQARYTESLIGASSMCPMTCGSQGSSFSSVRKYSRTSGMCWPRDSNTVIISTCSLSTTSSKIFSSVIAAIDPGLLDTRLSSTACRISWTMPLDLAFTATLMGVFPHLSRSRPIRARDWSRASTARSSCFSTATCSRVLPVSGSRRWTTVGCSSTSTRRAVGSRRIDTHTGYAGLSRKS